MNAIEREFNMEVKQRKNIGYGAYHKKNGSKSKKCSLPSDNLTAAQKRKLNGPVQTYAISQPMTWEEFKAMPFDLQQAHIDHIQNRFAAGLNAISKYNFGLAPETLRHYVNTHGLDCKKFDQGHKGDIDGLRLWAKGLLDPPTETTELPEPSMGFVQDTVTTASVAPTETVFPGLDALPELFGNGKLCMSGKAEEVIPRLLTLIGGNEAWLSVHLSFTNRKED